jgi:hypothetical protein
VHILELAQEFGELLVADTVVSSASTTSAATIEIEAAAIAGTHPERMPKIHKTLNFQVIFQDLVMISPRSILNFIFSPCPPEREDF